MLLVASGLPRQVLAKGEGFDMVMVDEPQVPASLDRGWLGPVGIGYRADLVREVPDSWLDLFRPDAATCGKVQVFANARELVGAALKAGGDSANSTDPLAYQRAERAAA
jgi:hypothetical protein